jgi:hypothetical protein
VNVGRDSWRKLLEKKGVLAIITSTPPFDEVIVLKIIFQGNSRGQKQKEKNQAC